MNVTGVGIVRYELVIVEENLVKYNNISAVTKVGTVVKSSQLVGNSSEVVNNYFKSSYRTVINYLFHSS